ncbi:glutathione S-transferase family protein [Bowmanella sp. JS7-9]|uniref:Glutathione S-transferase family protein n=1 Tax=Pseudobowmanella zhangzhouensis TaxID=1537679 RepID=A0ABW1XI10_9ALTE|nr:glutathione S-transferase family protein [Bowmanella sp. JS7-9]TBX25673.1 glutathione S-transferase [Bowmanella sp. JS7-9]
MKVYGDLKSGNCYKVKLLLDLLKKPHEWVHVDVVAGDTQTPSFLAKNPVGKIPLLEIEEDCWLSESNAILFYLAEGTEFMPTDPLGKAQVLQWQFFEQYSHEPYIAVARYIVEYLGNPPEQQARLESTRAPGYRALAVMEQHLRKFKYMVGMEYSVADISLYAYTHVAAEGGFALDEFPAIRDWIARLEMEPGHEPMATYLANEPDR